MRAVPADLPAGRRTAVTGLAARILALTRMRTGILHLEAISRPGSASVYPVEWAVREPGHAIMDLINWRYGGRATPYLVGMHLGRPLPDAPAELPERVAVTVFIDLPAGTILRVRQDRDPNTIPGVVDFDFYGSTGDVTEPARDNWGTFGAYSVLARDRSDLRRALDELDEAFGVLVRLETGGEVWCRASAQARAEVLANPGGGTGDPARARARRCLEARPGRCGCCWR